VLGQLSALRWGIQIGDLVAMPRKNQQTVVLGRVTGGYEYRNDLPADCRHARTVEWFSRTFERDHLASDLRGSFRTATAVFQIRVPGAADRLLSLEAAHQDPGPPSGIVTRRAWLVRGSSVNGQDLVPTWLAQGWCSIEASRLSAIEETVSGTELRQIVSEAYSHKDYSSRERLAREVEAFLRRMRPDDIVLTAHEGAVIIGLIEGDPQWVDSEGASSNLRRPVRWLNGSEAIDLAELPAPLPALLGSQDDVVDLTDALEVLESLIAEHTPPQTASTARALLRPLVFEEVTEQLAEDLLLDHEWLVGLTELLWERKQVIL
jgi:5-methylcytosine-specific restriction protein B